MSETPHVRAYLKWEQAGYPPGDGFDFWIAAEQELELESNLKEIANVAIQENKVTKVAAKISSPKSKKEILRYKKKK